MTYKLLVTGTAIAVLAAGAAQAATHRHHAANTTGARSETGQMVAYTKYDAWLKATPYQRAHGDWGLDTQAAAAAAQNAAANASATAPQGGSMGAATQTGAAGFTGPGMSATPPATSATPPPTTDQSGSTDAMPSTSATTPQPNASASGGSRSTDQPPH